MVVIDEILKIHGIGHTHAAKLISMGLKSIQDLNEPKYYNTLSDEAKLMLKYKVSTEIPREVLERFISLIPIAIPVGSYRRGELYNNDLDLIILYDVDGDVYGGSVDSVDSGSVDSVDSGSVDSVDSGSVDSVDSGKKLDMYIKSMRVLAEKNSQYKILGEYAHGDQKRAVLVEFAYKNGDESKIYNIRVDICAASVKELPFMILHFTGPAQQNIILRKLAKDKNMLLNQHGIYSATSGKLTSIKNKKFNTETDIINYVKYGK